MKKIIMLLIIFLTLIQVVGCKQSNEQAMNGSDKLPSTNKLETSSLKNEVNGDWVYFINAKDKYRIYKKKQDDSSIIKVCDDERIASVSVLNDWVYYSHLDGDLYLYKIKTDGSSKEKICDLNFLGDIVEVELTTKIEGNWIVFETETLKQPMQKEVDITGEPEKKNNSIRRFRVSLDGTKHEEI